MFASLPKMKRAAIFRFSDPDGIADTYIDYYLRQLSQVVDRLIVFVSGQANDSARELFQKYSDEIVTNEKEIFEKEILSQCEELVLCDDAVFGPLFPLSTIFEKISEQKEADYWDLVARSCEPFAQDKSFLFFSKNILSSVESLHDLWDIESLRAKGFVCGTHRIHEISENETPIYNLTIAQLENEQLPFVMREKFYSMSKSLFAGEDRVDVYNFIEENTTYNTDMIWAWLLRRCHGYHLLQALSLFYVLPKQGNSLVCGSEGLQRVVLILHCYYPELFRDALYYARKMPKYADIYITTNDQGKANELMTMFSAEKNFRQVLVVSNRGRSESALLIGLKDVISNYDIACFWKEKKSPHVNSEIASSWAYKISENLLHSKQYIEQILMLFAKNRRLGLLAAPPPHHGIYLETLGREWMIDNYENVVDLSRELSLHVPMDEDVPPVAPFGGAFWFRTKALKKLFEKNWKWEDFPEEPIHTDSTLLHTIERIYPFVAQDAGYYSAYVLSDEYARVELSNLSLYTREYNRVLIETGRMTFDINEATKFLRKRVKTSTFVRRAAKKILPKSVVEKIKRMKK